MSERRYCKEHFLETILRGKGAIQNILFVIFNKSCFKVILDGFLQFKLAAFVVICHTLSFDTFHQLGPLGRVGLVVAMSVCLYVHKN